MGKPVQPQTLAMCAIYRQRIAEGDDEREVVGDLARQFGIQRAAVRKGLRSGGALPPYVPQEDAAVRHRARTFDKRADQEERLASLRPAPLEPCARCGVRADVGCAHRPPSGVSPVALTDEPDTSKPNRQTGQGWSLHKERFAGGLQRGLESLRSRPLIDGDEQS